jgi:hypothetical protein
MTWIGLLLADASPSLRLLVLRDLLGRAAADAEVRELVALQAHDPVLSSLLTMQRQDGAWAKNDLAGLGQGVAVYATAQALLRLGYCGLGAEHPAVVRGADFLFTVQQGDGAWPLTWGEGEEGNEGYSIVSLQTSLPLRALAACGYATDARCERAYEWLLAQRLPDGAWPTGIAGGGVYGGVAGYRRLAHSRWGCRSNTTGALACLALHPTRRDSPEARRALDLLLGRETREASALGFEVARTIGLQPARGFLTTFARFDGAQMLDLCWRVGASMEDERVAELVQFVRSLQGAYGLWEYAARPQASRWVTFDVLRSLARLEDRVGEAWLSQEPRTPFQPYPQREKRY